MFRSFLQIPGVTFYSLQKGAHRLELASVPDLPIQEWSDRLHDFADTAAAIAQLDLVISVDTAVAHLAGAMAKPIWVLLAYTADWRWLRQRRDSPWYPTAQLFPSATSLCLEGRLRPGCPSARSVGEIAMNRWFTKQTLYLNMALLATLLTIAVQSGVFDHWQAAQHTPVNTSSSAAFASGQPKQDAVTLFPGGRTKCSIGSTSRAISNTTIAFSVIRLPLGGQHARRSHLQLCPQRHEQRLAIRTTPPRMDGRSPLPSGHHCDGHQ